MAQSFQKDQVKPTGKKQLVILGVLILVLVGALAHYCIGQAPQSANADTTEDAVQQPKAPRDSIKELLDDPTKDLLRGQHEAGLQFENAPTNPFAMADRWRSALTRQDAIAPPVIHTPDIEPQPVYVAPRVHAEIDTSAIKLQGIMRGSRATYAIINGNIVKVGGLVGNLRVIEILGDSIRLQSVTDPDAPTVEITVKSKMR
jgi:hypothetical protein